MHVRRGITISSVGVTMDDIVSRPPDVRRTSLHDSQNATERRRRKWRCLRTTSSVNTVLPRLIRTTLHTSFI